MKLGKRHYPGYIPEGLIIMALTWVVAAMLYPIAAQAAHHQNKNLAFASTSCASFWSRWALQQASSTTFTILLRADENDATLKWLLFRIASVRVVA